MEYPDPATHNRLGVAVDRPGETRSGPEIHPVRVVRMQRVEHLPKIHPSKIGSRRTVHDLGRDGSGGIHLNYSVVVVAKSQIQNQVGCHSPVVLDECSPLIEMRFVRRCTERCTQRRGSIRKEIRLGLIRERRVLWIDEGARLTHPTEPEFHEVAARAATEFLFEAVGFASRIPYFRSRRPERTGDVESRHAASVRHDLRWLVRADDAQELIETREMSAVPSPAALRHPRPACEDKLRRNAIRLVRKYSIVRSVHKKSRKN